MKWTLFYDGNSAEWSAIWSEIIGVIWNHKYDFRPKFHDTKLNCHLITSILQSRNFIAFRQHFASSSGTGNVLTSHLVCKKTKMSCDENSFRRNKGTILIVRTKTVYFKVLKVQFPSSVSMMEGLAFFCGSRWAFSLSLENKLKIQPVQFCDEFLL